MYKLIIDFLFYWIWLLIKFVNVIGCNPAWIERPYVLKSLWAQTTFQPKSRTQGNNSAGLQMHMNWALKLICNVEPSNFIGSFFWLYSNSSKGYNIWRSICDQIGPTLPGPLVLRVGLNGTELKKLNMTN